MTWRSVSAKPSASTSLMAILAPDRANSTASARPIPEPAPVTTATLPLKPSISVSLLDDCQIVRVMGQWERLGIRNRSPSTNRSW
ncbi:Uncharacterised protein [Mycobacteroides abscessus subsp. abscessus]|nr:Uncharacterised protein [Mycobacteroides abscessus subsp. abscessus]